jgi:hypothetical protein
MNRPHNHRRLAFESIETRICLDGAACATEAPVSEPVATASAAPIDAAAAQTPVAATTELVCEVPHRHVVERELSRRETDDGFVMTGTLAVNPPFAESVEEHGKADPAGAKVDVSNDSGDATVRVQLTTTPPPADGRVEQQDLDLVLLNWGE